jgi:hypothetical protein
MANFVLTTQTKTAVRELATPLTNLAAHSTLVGDILEDNPWLCTDYTYGGEAVEGVTTSKEYFSGKVEYTDVSTGRVIGTITVKAPTASGFTGAIATVLADADIATDMGGIASHDSSADAFMSSLKCHDSNGETYYVAIGRDSIRISSYTADSIVTVIETWADLIPALA